MPERTSYAQGTPSWVDLQTTDPGEAKAFYSGLFGWGFDDMPMGDGSGAAYSMATVDGKQVAAISPQPPPMAEQGVPPMWSTYITVDDVDATTSQVGSAGGQVMMEPFDILEAGRMAVVADPTGGAVALWQAKDSIGAELVNEPGTLIWNELHTPDVETAGAFLTALLGVTTEEMDMGGPYTVFKAGDDVVGGITPPPIEGLPTHWDLSFCVTDIEESLAKVTDLRGTVVAGPIDTPIGRAATVTDPQGAMFSLFEPQPGDDG